MERPTKRSSDWYNRQVFPLGQPQGAMSPNLPSAKTSWGQRLTTFGKRYWFHLVLLGLFAFWCKRNYLSQKPPPAEPTQHRFDPPPLQLPQGSYTKGEEKKVADESNTKSTPLSITNVLALPNPKEETKTKNSATETPTKSTQIKNFDDISVQSFCKRFEQTAITERKKFGIPSSIILANAILHSHAGKRNLTIEANNHFALRATTDWRGKVIRSKRKNYRQYETAWLSFRDHSLFLSSGKYALLSKQHSPTDYKNWARAIQRLGFATDIPNLADELVKTIEKYQLQKFDVM